ncbi:Hormone-sensitive lipase [Hyphodiscus hymeniophilus]|uniref:Hormone-sensitive lipase n=1 Tax=Hyphodiscus hymeniophilus TaxID=353542 RepID=A0A9P6VKL9_9HELO|nr:Hormone-sensitive lipase [Hyphodiscus hymeniophilus]
MVTHRPPPIAVSTATIKVDHRESRSAANHAVQKVIKVFSSLILKAGEPEPAGSPQLTVPSAAKKECRIVEYQVEEIFLYRFSKADEPEDSPKSKRHKLFYFAGGGFRGRPTKEHWLLCAEFCSNMPQYEVNLVSYPLAPNSPAHVSITHIQRLYHIFEKEGKAQGSRITLAGDSAGGNIALLLGIFGASKHIQDSGDGECVIESIMAICPAVDHRNENPHIDTIDPLDPILSRKVIEEVSEGWKGEWLLSDPRLSPILADLSCFKQAGVKVDGVIALHDVLSPDAVEFVNRLSESEVEGEWLQWEKQMHCFPLMFSHGIHEAVAGKDWIVNVLRRRSQSP